jgi:hypothetical protein
MIPFLFAFAFFGRLETMNMLRSVSNGSGDAMIAASLACAMIAWAWVGSLIAPSKHRRLALAVFSAPVALLTLVIVVAIVIEGLPSREDAEAWFLVIGVALAWIGISALALYRRYAMPPLERRMTIDQTADVFADETDQTPQAQK